MTGDLLWPSLWSAAQPPLVLCCTPPPPPPPPCQPGRVRLEVRRSWPRHNTHPGITKQVSSLPQGVSSLINIIMREGCNFNVGSRDIAIHSNFTNGNDNPDFFLIQCEIHGLY